MRNLNNKAFFLAETIVVVGVVATILILFYSQIASFYANYERNSKYQTVEAIHAARNIQEYLKQYGSSATSLVDATTPIYDITTYNFDATGQYANLISKLGIKTAYISLYNINTVITNYASYGFNPTFVDFLRTQKVSDTKANTYRIIVLLNNGEYAHAYLTSDFTYAYTGDYQTFVAPQNGNYKVELWGASGQNRGNGIGGNGGYTKGTVYLTANTTLYVYVGEGGQTLASNPPRTYNYNGGGYQGLSTSYAAHGGGATDIRLTSGTWNDVNSLRSRIMVAGGGGNGYNYGTGGGGGAGGGLTGYKGQTSTVTSPEISIEGGEGANQTAGGAGGQGTDAGHGPGLPGSFGIGGICNNNYGGGGGGGYYGGGGGGANSGRGGGGGGGSSFISGYPGCNAIDASGSHTNQPNHYSGYVFNNMQMIDGISQMTNPAGNAETGHTGNGYARITYIGQ